MGDILLITENNFVGWAVMPRKIDDKALNHPLGDAAGFVQLPNVKQIPRVLSIKRSDQLAPVKLIRRQYGKIKFNAKPIARAGTQRTPLWSQHATTKDGVDLNFDLTGFAFDDQLGIAKISGRNQSRICLLYTSPSPRDRTRSRMPSSA